MKYLFIAEKPSLMRDVQSCYKKHKSEIINKIGEMDFIALSGHVCRVGEPNAYEDWANLSWDSVDYPMIPKTWKIEPINDDYKRKTLNTIKNAISNYDGVVVGTDSDVEGYGIYYLLEQYLGIQKKKAVRFIEHSLTDEEILDSLLTMTDFHTDPVHNRSVNSYIIRLRADWLYGMNGTRMISVKQDNMMAVGRVKAPTIKLVYDNSMAIDNFKSRKYYQVEADYGTFTASLLNDAGNIAQFDDKSKIQKYPLEGEVIDIQVKKATEHAPKLYDLSALQTEAGKKFGYSPSETLEIVQSLYETHKVISYPRTQCRYVSSAKSNEFPMMLSHMDAFSDLAPYAKNITPADIKRVQGDKQVVNNTEVEKESHDALLPTSKKPVLSELNVKEQNICQMIFTRLLAQFLPIGEDEKVQLVIKHGDGKFSANGKTVINQGWRVLYTESKDKNIPKLNKGEKITANKIDAVEKNTTPPKRLTQSTLLDAMLNIASQIEDPELKKSLAESKGIGTPATRASIIADIIRRGYVEEKKQSLYITKLGIQYINAIKDLDIVSPVFAAILDTEIKKVQRGEATYDDTYDKMLNGLRNMCHQIESMESAVKQINATCPVCGKPMKVSRFKYECTECDFAVQKQVCSKEIDEQLLRKLLAGETSPILQFKKKDGTKFEAKLVMKENKLCFDSSVESTNCKCPICQSGLTASKYRYTCPKGDFEISRIVCGKTIDDKLLEKLIAGETSQQYTFKKKDNSTFKARLKLVGAELQFDFSSGVTCPMCGKDTVKINKGGAFCDCGLQVFRKMSNREFSDTELKKLLKDGQLNNLDGFKKKDGTDFSASVIINNDGKTEFVRNKKN